MSRLDDFFTAAFAPEKRYMQQTLASLYPKAEQVAVDKLISSVTVMARSMIVQAEGSVQDVAMERMLSNIIKLRPRVAPDTPVEGFVKAVDRMVETVVGRFNLTVIDHSGELCLACGQDEFLSQELAQTLH